jgi:hypothetical protein
MQHSDIREFIIQCKNAASREIRWVDAIGFSGENIQGAAPGGYLNRFGYYVIGTTVGGNAIVLGDDDERVLFADYTWYSDDEINYEDIAGDGEWHTLPMDASNMRQSLYELARNQSDFLEKLRTGEIDRLLEPIS